MKVYLNRRYRFSASHRLHQPNFDAEKNREVYGKCNNPFGHGHNYILEVRVSGPVNPDSGMVCNLAELDEVIGKNVIELLHDSNLNELPMFAGEVPTTENLCRFVYQRLKGAFQDAVVECVRLEETMSNSFAYAGEANEDKPPLGAE